MKQQFKGWPAVARELRALAGSSEENLNDGQRASLRAIADRIAAHGLLIADEVGMGKTRIAAALAHCVVKCGGRVGVLIPPGLGFQWQAEFRVFGRDVPEVLRSLDMFHQRWRGAGQTPWYEEDIVMVSHSFCNWNMKSGTQRFALLPEVYACWKKADKRRVPGHSVEDAKTCLWGGQTAPDIVAAVPRDPAHPAFKWLQEITEKYTYPQLQKAEHYQKHGDLRPELARAVGLGLGMFDLLLIDEAHKSRGEISMLSQLLEHVVLRAPDMRRVAITATPVELNEEQWQDTLARVGVKQTFGEVKRYADAVRQLRGAWRANPQVRAEYAAAAKAFQEALSPYVLRRDKRSDATIRRYAEKTGLPADTYREVDRHIHVKLDSLSLSWKRAVCAAEALSVIKPGAIGTRGKRLRLTFGNGHGIAGLIDQFNQDSAADQAQLNYEEEGSEAIVEKAVSADDKRSQRAQWWSGVIANAFAGNSEDVLYEHPAIQATAACIEKLVADGEKVLVFGRFTKPMETLVKFLNACEMLRRLNSGKSWPQSKIHEGDTDGERGEWPAVSAAYRWVHKRDMTEEDQRRIASQLRTQYEQLEAARKRFRAHLMDRLEGALENRSAATISLFRAFRAHAQDAAEHGSLAAVSRAMLNLRPEFLTAEPQAHELADTFIEVLRGAMDRDDPEAMDGEIEAGNAWPDIAERLSDEFLRPEGGFARLMDGSTRPHSRQMLQQAFNRRDSFPQVLVAQSMVGREGLNLHRECRTVVMMHPEWNPGVVEQQIGRVDRVGSCWSRLLEKALEDGTQPQHFPRIMVKSVIFEGTYDARHWEVLQERWQDLRAQLHGIPIPQGTAEGDEEGLRLIGEINAAAPDFSPR
ncbi:DEAD/DEAH box helicase [Pseudoduganella sp.]|uniref:DEAD/DEAH box helicase n=1 Tax=Pseudoduganella sp. TaxID=1880898 RepID=UPI0035B022AD